jgi:hypothetical protein
MLVAGRRQQYPGIKALLTRAHEIGLSINRLVTDDWPAGQLLRDLPPSAATPKM